MNKLIEMLNDAKIDYQVEHDRDNGVDITFKIDGVIATWVFDNDTLLKIHYSS